MSNGRHAPQPAAAAVLAAGVWVFYLQIYFPIHQAEMAREHSIAQAMARGETEITVVRYPNSAWLWEPGIPKDGGAVFLRNAPRHHVVLVKPKVEAFPIRASAETHQTQ